MLFPSYQFIFLFLPLVLGSFYGLYLLGRKGNLPAVLLLFSLIFYLLPNWVHGHIIVASIIVNYWLSRKIQSTGNPFSKILLVLGVTYNLAVIGYYKYSFFFGEIYTQISGQDLGLTKFILPVGISFYTFQQIAYLADCYRDRDTYYKFSDYALFVIFFPQLIAGPIVHHKEIMPQISELKVKRFQPLMIQTGIAMFIFGLFKKLALADNFAKMANPVFIQVDAGGSVDAISSWIATMSYTLQLYFDFSAYSDMAIGLGLMFGLKLPINFLSPYKSNSIVDFWRRWHMTLSRFLRDYLYIALGGNQRGIVRRYLNLAITMLLGGLWHGAGWNFIVWGGLHGCYLVINQLFSSTMKKNNWHLPVIIAKAITLIAVMIGWVFFRAETLDGALEMIDAMFLFSSTTTQFHWIPGDIIFLILGWIIVLGLPNLAEFYGYTGAHTSEQWQPSLAGDSPYRRLFTPIMLGLLMAAALVYMPQPTVFIYFNF